MRESVKLNSVDEVIFFVRGEAKSTQLGSSIPLKGKRKAFLPRRGGAWSAKCGLAAEQHAPPEPWTDAIEVWLTFYLKTPKKRGARPTKRPDVENLGKGILDQFNGVLWDDDAQVTDLHYSKRYAIDRPIGVLVRVVRVRGV